MHRGVDMKGWNTGPITEPGDYIIIQVWSCKCCYFRVYDLWISDLNYDDFEYKIKLNDKEFPATSDTVRLEDIIIDGKLYYDFWVRRDEVQDVEELKWLEIEENNAT